ncbi:MAG: helicase [Armatimonadota bacterium]|nr:MAG: helicase [Armatimonadota bacterium]
MTPGTIVRLRGRDWVLLPNTDETLILLRPLTGATEEVVAVHRELTNLIGYELPQERITPSAFPPPDPADVQDAAAVHLFWQAARLTLRDGAAPLRSLGRISIRPRNYQFVPLLMALKLHPVRLLIADDVGTGKTAEALLIAKELMERGEIRRMCVLCPPYLCEQWQRELQEKFNMEAVVIRSGTIAQLERAIPSPSHTVYEYFPVQVASIDFIKSERNKHLFLQYCPELVIVDEVHGAAEAFETNRSQQQRHQLLREVARDENRHIILLTATPHSGIESAFRSILGLLRADFRDWDMRALSEAQRQQLAQHFIQRTRRDIQQVWEGGRSQFPERLSQDVEYRLSEPYRRLFEQTYAFCREIVQTGELLESRKQRVRYWGALALLRCVMSSPAAAVEALQRRRQQLRDDEVAHGEESDVFAPFVQDVVEEQVEDETPLPPIEATESTLVEDEIKRLRELEQQAHAIWQSGQDTKASGCIEVVKQLLQEGYHPIVWCRYVATAEYLGAQMRSQLGEQIQVTVITGRLSDDERRIQIEEIDATHPRVLVATDCLSEGINLQDKFTAVVHYDLPWNPNRLEQREGRVDRFGQTAPTVRAIRYWSPDNPIDGVVIRVLLDKARKIHQTLGTYVPVPGDSESVLEAVLKALFLKARSATGRQLMLDIDLAEPAVTNLHQQWDSNAERERINRTRFAQRAIKPQEVQRELEACDNVLGDAQAVREFVLNACQRLGISYREHPQQRGVYELIVPAPGSASDIPVVVRETMPSAQRSRTWRIAFVSPTPEGAEYVGRNHRFVVGLARWLMEDALERSDGLGERVASRCGAIRTHSVQRLTVLLLLRVRYLVQMPTGNDLLAEEVIVTGYEGLNPAGRWLERERALELLLARPDENMSLTEKRELVEQALAPWRKWFHESIEQAEASITNEGDAHRAHFGVHPQAEASTANEGDAHRAYFGVHPQAEASTTNEGDARSAHFSAPSDGGAGTEQLLALIRQRARELEDSHKRIRQVVALRVRDLKVREQLPPDLLAILVLQPVVNP